MHPANSYAGLPSPGVTLSQSCPWLRNVDEQVAEEAAAVNVQQPQAALAEAEAECAVSVLLPIATALSSHHRTVPRRAAIRSVVCTQP
jgi:hypothetical protein